MKVLLHFLQKDANRKALKFAANRAFDADVQAFVVDQFQITCVPTHIPDFVEELHRRCRTAGILRTIENTPKQTRYERWAQMVQADELGELLDELVANFTQQHPADTDSQNQLFQLNGRLANLERAILKGVIAPDHALRERNLIRDALIQFLNETVRPLDL